jgi:hypothetical protein
MQIVQTSSTLINEPLPQSWVEKMFDQMLLNYGRKFTEQWGGADPDKLINHWARDMASYTPAEIKRGLAALELRDWPPTLPEFKKLCRPPMDVTAAYYEAIAGLREREAGEMGNWTHPAIFWTTVHVGAFDLKNQSYSQIKERWEKALQAEMGKGQWSAIPEPMIALPAPGKGRSSREEAARALSDLGAADILKPRTNHKAWIKSVLERAQKGDETLPGISIRFAKEAMNAPGTK